MDCFWKLRAHKRHKTETDDCFEHIFEVMNTAIVRVTFDNLARGNDCLDGIFCEDRLERQRVVWRT